MALGQAQFNEWWGNRVAAAIPVPEKMEAGSLAALLFEAAVPGVEELSPTDRTMARQKFVKLCSFVGSVAYDQLATTGKAAFGISKAALRSAVREFRRTQALVEDDDDQWADLKGQFGEPIHRDQEGNPLGVNERFWAAWTGKRFQILYEPGLGQFFRYVEGEGIWTPLPYAAVRQLVCQNVIDRYGSESGLIRYLDDRFAKAVVSHMEGLCEQRNVFDAVATGVAVANGFLRLNSKEYHLESFSPTHFLRNKCPIRFDPAEDCPRFYREVLSSLSEEDVKVLQRYMGQCILGRNITQTILCMVGPGGSGKSTVSNIFQGLVGAKNCMELRTEHLTKQFEIFRFLNRSLLYGADVRAKFFQSESATMLKKLTGGDLISPEGKYKNESYCIRGSFNVIVVAKGRSPARRCRDKTPDTSPVPS